MRWNYYKLWQLSLLQSAMDSYYKLRQLFYYKVRHGLLQQVATGITMSDGFITNCDSTKRKELANFWRKKYFKNELKYSKRSDHMTMQVITQWLSFGRETHCQGEHYFPALPCGWKVDFYNPRPSLSAFTLMLIILPLKFYAGRQLHGYFEMLRTTKTLNMLKKQQKLKLAIITWLMPT